MAIASQDHASKQLQLVARALEKIGDGDYGFCEECAEPILFARLQVQPTARLCVTCQSAAEIV
ncbi:MAG: TraR/DksA family transcriptional regulator [Planctomycetota bacterium]